MNERARRMLRGDGRNPYGSRGGYVTSRDPRSRRDRGDYDYDDRDMERHRERDGHYYREYDEYPTEEIRGSFEMDRRYSDYDDDMREHRGKSRYMDDYEEDYRSRRRNARGQYMRDRGRDYDGDDDMKLSKHDIKEWEEDMVNDDGSKGFKFTKEQVMQTAHQMNIDMQKFDEDTLWVAANLKYNDGCLTAKKFGVDRLEYYIEGGKEFLEDKDFDGDGAEKLFLYYKFIADSDK